MEFVLEAIAMWILIGISAFFSASEVAFLSVSNIRLHSLLEKNAEGAQSLHRLRHNRRKVIISLLIGSNVANIAASALATSVCLSLFGDAGLGISVGIMSFLLLTFGDIAPKSFATTYSEKIMLKFSPILETFYAISYPLVLVFEFINRLIPGVYSRPMGIEKFTEEELRAAVNLGAEHNSISQREKQMIENVLVFEDKTVAHVMTPKARIVFFNSGTDVVDAQREAIESMHSRFPVLREGKAIGIVGLRALARAIYIDPKTKVEKIAIPPIKIRSSDRLHVAFATLQTLGRHMAIVVDDKGEFVGILTFEDLFEELVGTLN